MPFGLGLGELVVVLVSFAIVGVGATVLLRLGLRNPAGSPSHSLMEERHRALEAELQGTQAQLDDVRRQMVELEEKVAFTQSLLESRDPAGPALPPGRG